MIIMKHIVLLSVQIHSTSKLCRNVIVMFYQRFEIASGGPDWAMTRLSAAIDRLCARNARAPGLDFVHLGGVGEDVGELSVNCGWGVFSCRVSTLDFVQKLDEL